MNIITITPNPALDVHLESSGFTKGEYNKARLIRRDSGGKGVNLSRALLSNSVESDCFMMLGRDGAEEFILPLYNIGMRASYVEVEGRVRENLNIHHGATETVVATAGPAVSASAVEELRGRLDPLVGPGSFVALCGSLSDGSDKEAILALMYHLKRKGARLVIDSKSLSAEEIISLKPYLIKPNEEEAELLTGMRPTNIEEAARIAAAIRDSGCECVMLTMGGNGAALAAPSGEYTAIAPEVEVLSTVGAGDSSLAGFIAAVSEGKDHTEALRRAVSYGSAACMSEGSLPPTPENVAALLPLVEVKRLND